MNCWLTSVPSSRALPIVPESLSKLRAVTSPNPTRWQHQYQTDHLHRDRQDCLPGVAVPACKAAVRLRQHLG
jgi:hypothetical protein